MSPRLFPGVGLLGALMILAPVSAQEAGKPRRKAVPVKAVRMVAATQQKPLSQEELKARFEAKSLEPFVSAVAWETDHAAAQRVARDSGKRIFAYFTRSYAP